MALTRIQATPAAFGNPITMTFATAPVVGRAVIVGIVGWGGALISGATCTDNYGNTYTPAVTVSNPSQQAAIFYAVLAASGSPFTITYSGGPQGRGVAVEVAIDPGKTFAIDRVTSNVGSSATPSTGTTAAITGSDDFAMIVSSFNAGPIASLVVESVTPPWLQELEGLSFDWAMGEVDTRAVSGTTQSGSWTTTPSQGWVAAIAVFKATSGVVPPAPTTTDARVNVLKLNAGQLSHYHAVKVPLHARLKRMRLGASRLDYYNAVYIVLVNGMVRRPRVAGATITHNLDSVPDTAALRVSGFAPETGSELAIYLGDRSLAHCLFAGHILAVTTVYEAQRRTNIAYDLSCIDYTWRLNEKRPLCDYANRSATDIARDLMTRFGPAGFSSDGVEANLPVLDEITFTNEDFTDALDRITARIGAYWLLDYAKTLRIFLAQSESASTVTEPDAHGWTIDALEADLSQVRTRAIVRGGGSNASADVPAGATSLPVEDQSWYASAGGLVEIGTQRVSYGGIIARVGEGAPVGGASGTIPAAPSVNENTPRATGNLVNFSGSDVYRYGVTFVSAGGETALGPGATGSITKIAYSQTQASATPQSTGGNLVQYTAYAYIVHFVTASGECGYPVAYGKEYSFGYQLQPGQNAYAVSVFASADPRVTSRNVYRAWNGDTQNPYGIFKLDNSLGGNTATQYTDTLIEYALTTLRPTADTGSTGKILVGLPVGPAGTTARKLYRTVVNGSTFKLLATINDNTTTSYLDNIADAALGADYAGATSGTSPGASKVHLTDLSMFPPSGWARAGSVVFSYSGKSVSTGEGDLTGVPPTGYGSITSALAAGTMVLVEPQLVGIPASGAGSVTAFVNRGDPINVRVERNDTAAQAALAAMLGTGDGVVEDFQSDGRLSVAECQNVADARLAAFKNPLVTLRGSTRDQTVRIGRWITFDVTTPPVRGTFKIQRVTLSGLAATPALPLRRVEASSQLFSLEDLVRQIRGMVRLKATAGPDPD